MTTPAAVLPGSSAKSIVVVGSLNMDLVLRVSRAPAAGETLMGRQFSMVPGGKGANQAVACARLGAPVALIGSLGADAFGAQLRQVMAGDGIDTAHVVTDERSATGVAMIQVDDDGQNRIVVVSGANGTLEPRHVDAAAAAIDRAALMILQFEVPLVTVEHAVDRAVRAGLPVLLNPAPVQALPDRLWPKIDYLIPNESEASALAGIPVTDPPSAIEAARILRSRGVRHVLVTLGGQGVVIAGPDEVRHLSARPVQAVDTTAAGDTFIGGVAVGLLEGMALREAADLGQRAAAFCVTRHGAQPAIPFRAELSGPTN